MSTVRRLAAAIAFVLSVGVVMLPAGIEGSGAPIAGIQGSGVVVV
jgi:hypothetical protein